MNIFRRPRIYADAAAATPLSAHSRAELVRLLSLYGNAGAIHAEGVAAMQELEHARGIIAQSIGAHADEIVFTASGTEANNLAIEGVLRPMLLAQQNPPRRSEVYLSGAEDFAEPYVPHVVTTVIEHASVLEPLRALGREGVRTTECGVDSAGLVDPTALKEALMPETVLVSVQLVNSEVGTIEPIHDIAKMLRHNARKIYFHTDASQAPLWLPLNVDKLGVDLMTLDAQKVLGPKGVGCLYVRRGTPIEPILWGGSQERALRAGTANVPLAGAFAAALADAARGVEQRAARAAAVRDYLWSAIAKRIDGALINGPQLGSNRAANNLNISIPGLEAQMAVVALDSMGIAVSTRSACSAGEEEPSHVIKALGVPPELAGTAVRITLLPDATKADARRIAAALFEAAKLYRKT